MQKVEDMDYDERRKLRKMLSEKTSDDTQVNMNWMYKKSATDSEDFLLGKRVDKIEEEKEEESASINEGIGALFDDAIARRAGIDMHAKMREDPLYAIKKREEDAKRRLLENPIKMKQLESMLKEKQAKKDKKKKKKEKKRKRKHKHDSDSDIDNDEDDALMHKYLDIIKHKSRRGALDVLKLKRSLDDSDSDSDSSPRKRRAKDSSESPPRRHHGDRDSDRKHQKMGSREDSRRDRHSRTSRDKYKSSKSQNEDDTDRQRNSKEEKYEYKSQYRSSKHRSKRYDSSSSLSDDNSKQTESAPKNFGLLLRGSPPPRARVKREKSVDKSPVPIQKPEKSKTKRKLTTAEKEARRKEMMEDAEWRDKQREENVRNYAEEDRRDREKSEQEKPKGSQFLKPLMMKHADSSSVEDRLKRNIYKIQRTSADMEKSFKR